MKMKKVLALTMSATMAMGIAMPVMAADPTVTAPIYSFEVLDVVVPTTYEVAFNPEGLAVKTDSSGNPSTDQIISRNYGMINKGNKDQVMTVALKVEDQNTGDNKVTFVDSEDEVDNAEADEYKIHLTAIAADTTEVKVGTTPASANKDTAATDLNNVTMTKAADTTAVTLKDGDNKLAFVLEKAIYTPKTTGGLELGGTPSDASNPNNVKDNFDLTGLAAGGAGISAFTFSGSMNGSANWSKLTAGIKITATYTNTIAPSDVDSDKVSGTGAMIKVGPDVTVSPTGLVTISGMNADKKFESMTVTNKNAADLDVNLAAVEWNRTNYNDTTGGTITCQLGEDWLVSQIGRAHV